MSLLNELQQIVAALPMCAARKMGKTPGPVMHIHHKYQDVMEGNGWMRAGEIAKQIPCTRQCAYENLKSTLLKHGLVEKRPAKQNVKGQHPLEWRWIED